MRVRTLYAYNYSCVPTRAKQPYVVAVPTVKFLCFCFVSVLWALLGRTSKTLKSE